MGPEKPTDCPTLDAYFTVLYEQARTHGREALQAKDYKDYRAWDLRIGFTSPDGWWTVKLRTIKAHYAHGRAFQQVESKPGIVAFTRLPPQEQLAHDFGQRARKARDDGDAAHKAS